MHKKNLNTNPTNKNKNSTSNEKKKKNELIPSILINSRITGVIQHIGSNNTYVTTALQEQKEQRQQQQKQYEKDLKHKYRKKQQKRKNRKEREQIERRLGRDNEQQDRVEIAQHNKQQEYFEDFIMKQSKANDVTGSINKLYIDMKNKSMKMLDSNPTKTKTKNKKMPKKKKKKKKKKYEMKRLVLQEIEHEIRQHEQQYKDNPDLLPDNPTRNVSNT